jgi:prevent-host-death family protein
MRTWQVQSAKQRFSEVIREAEFGEPQFITRRGEPVAVIVDIVHYRAAHPDAPPVSFKQFLADAPELGELELPERVLDSPRESALDER